MINETKRYMVIADETKQRDEYEVLAPGRDMNDAHVAARNAAKSEPGRRFYVVEVVGFHEAIVLPPFFTALGDPPMKSLPRFNGAASAPSSENMLS